MTHLVTRTQLTRLTHFIHHTKPSLKTKIPRSQFVTFPQFSTKTFPSLHRAQPPAMDAQPPESGAPVAGNEDFVHVHDLNMESLSDSMVRIDEPSSDATVAAAVAAAPPPGPESLLDATYYRPESLPEELSRNVIVLTCESATADEGLCNVYVVGTAHVSEVFALLNLVAIAWCVIISLSSIRTNVRV